MNAGVSAPKSYMKIRQIKAFLAVVRTGSVRRAAATLCITQSTVAKAVKELENELGTPLFVRSTKGLRLNAAGESLRPYAETIASNADNAVNAVNAVVTGRQERLSLSITPTLPPVILAAAMAHFRARFPRVKVLFRSGFLSDCLPHLLTDQIDLSLVMSGRHQQRALTSLAEEPLMEVDQGIVAAPDHPVFAPDADLKTVFCQSEWLSTAQDEAFLLGKLKEIGVTPRALTLCDFFGIDALKGRNGALSLSPLSVVEDTRYEGRLRALPKDRFPLPPLTISFFHRKGVELSPAADFMRFAIRRAFDEQYGLRQWRFVRPKR